MCKTRGAGGDVVRSKPGVGELGWRGGVEWSGFGIGVGGLWGVGGLGVEQQGWGGATLHTTSGSSVCGQGGCQALGLWIAGDCLRGAWGEAEEEDE